MKDEYIKFGIIDLEQYSLFFLISCLLKPFYLLPSGSFQLSDIFLVLSVLFLFSKSKFTGFLSCDKYLLVFVIFVTVINTFYGIAYLNISFFIHLSYYFFNFFVVYVFRNICNNKKNLFGLIIVLKINLLIQLMVYVIGAGKWFSLGRYEGTYNDPNQFAFAIFTTYCMLYCIDRIIRVKHKYFYMLLSVFLISLSSSMGMLSAMGILIVSEQYFKRNLITNKYLKLINDIYIILFTVLIIYLLYYVVGIALGTIRINESSFLAARLYQKFHKQSSGFIDSFIADRNLYAVKEYPWVMIYGSGEGMLERFVNPWELHSTWISIIFYYGVIAFLFLITWITKNLKSVEMCIIPVYLALFAEALTLINHRQPFFWMLIVMGSIIKYKDIKYNLLEIKV